jgi:hypothetical protein
VESQCRVLPGCRSSVSRGVVEGERVEAIAVLHSETIALEQGLQNIRRCFVLIHSSIMHWIQAKFPKGGEREREHARARERDSTRPSGVKKHNTS